jgi:hypothetical protein
MPLEVTLLDVEGREISRLAKSADGDFCA